MAIDRAVRVVACFEAAKGVLVLLAATGLLSLMHRDVYDLAVMLIEHSHLNPASKYPRIFLDAAAKLEDRRLTALAAGAALYALVRLVEAYGLYRERPWAEVLAAVGAAIYAPFELLGIARSPSWPGVGLLTVNLAVVALMVRSLRCRRAARP